MNIEVFTQFIRPELIVVPFILYAIGVAIKKSSYIKDEFIPLILGITSIAICAIYILAMSDTPKTYQEVLILCFNIIIQGVCCAAASVYCNQLIKQNKKLKESTKEDEKN